MRGEEPEVHLKRCKEDIFISPVSIPDAKPQHFWAIQIPAHLAAEAPDVPRQGTHPHGVAHPLLVSSASKHAWFKGDSLPNRSRSRSTPRCFLLPHLSTAVPFPSLQPIHF